ncbi:troponin T, skeletal muscle-like isoform X2 [Ruditapes philippinarum]|uniref:troponin T, skeletal muscle-like isoform X2 n=1 Tax=Ruditapes philippinarum TaxID=129788 RepID=UPI00295B67C1|nr:troponin T, skeletal muscle-like isoform X2 [Ruditapes philippinarum]XP_060555925.1 troponin T, skeletal muscle-like isoform X2 [Ruditapes philippinarum]
MSDNEDQGQAEDGGGEGETFQTFEEQQKRKEQKLAEEMEEYKAMRQSEKEKEAHDIEELKRKRKERQVERAEEEKRMAEQRREEEARRKVEEEERKKKRAEEEERRRREKERRRLEAEKRKGPKTPNFTIVKKEGGDEDEDEEKKSPQKTKEELEKDKQNALTSRITPLADTSSMSTDQLTELARNLHEQIRILVTSMYDTEDRYKRQQYDIVELQERARAMSKTKKKGITCVQYDDTYDRMNDRFSNAPPKILLCSKYERHTDDRSFDQRYKLYEELSADKPLPELLRIQAFGVERAYDEY